MATRPINVLITGAGGAIGYSVVPLACSGQMFGAETPVNLKLVDITPCMGSLAGFKMELDDCAYPLVKSIKMFDAWKEDQEQACWDGVDYAILVGGFPRKKGMLRADLLKKNKAIFEKAGKAMEKYANPNMKVLVIANPANTNCNVVAHFASKIPKENFCALTRLDQNRARGLLANKINDLNKSAISAADIKNMVIWGNHSKSQVPDAKNATVNGQNIAELVKDDAWLYGNQEGQFMHTVQYRGAAVIGARGSSSAMSAANAVKDCIRDWHCGTSEPVAMSVWSNGNSYGIPDNCFYSFPCTCAEGKWNIVNGVGAAFTELMQASAQELADEFKEALTE